MEVHAHSHPAPAGHRKKWTHYLWEFLMLFLAVFCGFLAEYQLEHKIEKDREKQYMRSLVEDLKADTSMLAGNIVARKQRIELIDAFIRLLNDPAAIRQTSNDLYYIARRVSRPTNIYPNDGTIQQLKSSGNLRLVHNKDIANSIMSYDQKMRKALFEMVDESEMRITIREQMVKVFDNRVFSEMTPRGDTIIRPAGNPALFSTDPVLINELTGDAMYLRGVHGAQVITSRQLLRQADSLLREVKKVYRLE